MVPPKAPPKPPKRKMHPSTRSPLGALICQALATSPTGYLSLNEVFVHLKESSHPYVRSLTADRLRKRIGDHLLTGRMFCVAPESFKSGRFRRYGLSTSEPASAHPSSPLPGPSTSPVVSVQPTGSTWVANYGILIPPFVYVAPQLDVSGVSNLSQGQIPSCHVGTSYSPASQVIASESVSPDTSVSSATSFTNDVSSCSLNPTSSCSIDPISSCSINPTSSCSVNPISPCSTNLTSSCSINPTSSCSVNPLSSCSANPSSSCSVNPTGFRSSQAVTSQPAAPLPPAVSPPETLHQEDASAISPVPVFPSSPTSSLLTPLFFPTNPSSVGNASQLPPSCPEAISFTSSSSTSVSPSTSSEMSTPSLPPPPALSPPPSFDLLCQMSSFVPDSTHSAALQPSSPTTSSSEVNISPYPVTSQPRLCPSDLPNPEKRFDLTFFTSYYPSSSGTVPSIYSNNSASTSSSISPSAYLPSSSSSSRTSSICEGSSSQTSSGNESGTEQTEDALNSDTKGLEDLNVSLPNSLGDVIEELHREWQVCHS